MIRPARTFFLGLALALVGAGIGHADDFNYVYTTDLLPKGHFEVEQWITDREGQAHGYYHDFENRTEVEYGLLNNLQISLYANYTYIGADRNSVRGLTEGNDIKPSHDPTHAYADIHNDGFSAELIWRVLSPYKDPLGLAFYIEPESGPKEYGVELRAIVQKNFIDDRLIIAFNEWLEFEREGGSNLGDPGDEMAAPAGGKVSSTYAESDLGVSYRFAPKWSAGLEFRNHNEYDGYSLDHADQDHTAFFLGPTIHYAGERWFFTFTAMRQLGAIGYTPEQKAQIDHGLLYGDEHTTWDGLRLRFGRTF